MKVVILAGGFGTRISEESQFKPKPMLEIGGKPILWHIMKLYSAYGFNDFVICAGYKQEVIKKYFFDYYLYNSDVTFDLKTNEMKVHNNFSEPWNVSVVDTGLNTLTGGRVKRVKEYIGNEAFFLTYGDGVANIELDKELEFHKKSGKILTISAYNLKQRFGIIETDKDGTVNAFREKARTDDSLINIGYMICQPEFLDYIDGDSTILEKEPMWKLVEEKQMAAFYHRGFWQCMDTVREKQMLEDMWQSGNAPWRVW